MAQPPAPPSVELKGVELTIRVPEALAGALTRMAQYRHISVEALVVRLVSQHDYVRRLFTDGVLDQWLNDEL